MDAAHDLEALAKRVEAAAGPDRELFREAWLLSWPRSTFSSGRESDFAREGFMRLCDAGAWLDAAMSLLPTTAVNLSITQFGRGWTVTFHDTAQRMGARAAHEKIERLLVQHSALADSLRGEPRLVMEKAIADHWLEFHCPCAATPALALAAASLRALSQGVNDD